MSEIKIEKDVPMPQKFRYPWRELEIGDSFCAPIHVRAGASSYGQLLNRKFKSKKISPTECRIWRVE